MSRLIRLRKQVGSLVVDGFFNGMSRLGSLHPQARPERHGIEVIRNVAYSPTGRREHVLDVWRPRKTAAPGPTPVVLYVHGGGFRILSKETHWVMALAFARRGFTVFNISYRLAPSYPFPAAIEDTCAAYAWVVEHAAEYGADASRLVLAGESAGANLITALTVATCFRREEPFARKVFDTGIVPSVVLPACGMLQVSDAQRIRRRKPKLSPFIEDRLVEVADQYLSGAPLAHPLTPELADPLLILESDTPTARPLPPCFASVGTRDPLLDDSRRLGRAMALRGVPCEVRYYPGELHAFQAMVFRPNAKLCWRDTFAFVDRHLPEVTEGVRSVTP